MMIRRLLAATVLAYPRITLVSALLLTLVSIQVTVQRLSFTSTRAALAPLKGRLAVLQEHYHRVFGNPQQAVIVIQSDDLERAKQIGRAHV